MTTPNSQPSSDNRAGNRHRGLVRKLLLVTVTMFAFGYALVPLYNVFCELTGINGKTGRIDAQTAQAGKVDTSRWVNVEFTSSVNRGMPWEFKPAVTRMRVHPGEVATANYVARNTVAEAITGQAVPSVVPNVAASHFKKIECFCFSQQTLQGHESKTMPVRFMVQPDLPKDVNTVVLSYTFFNADRASARKYGGTTSDMAQHDSGAHAHHAPAQGG